jgi:hypothetical protein
MTEQNLLKLAKQGNPKAIAAMLNQSLKSKNITAKVNLKDGCLHVLVESAQLPKQQTLVSFIRKGLIQLEAESIKTVKVYGRQTGEESPAWNETFEIVSKPETPSSTEEVDTQGTDSANLSSYQILRQPPRPASPKVEMPPSTRQTDLQTPQRSSAMPKTPNPTPSMGSLSVGNVVSAGLRIYRDHFKLYFGLAFQALLWSFVPIYGWAKNYQIQAMISRQVFKELVNQPESISTTRTQFSSRLWGFWIAQILIGLIRIGVNIGLFILAFIIIFVPTLLFSSIAQDNLVISIILGLLQLIVRIATIFIDIWVYSRFLIAELPLAIEDNITSTTCISRSWELTKDFVLRIQGVILVAGLITIPIILLALTPILLMIPSFTSFSSPEALIYMIISLFFWVLILILVSSTLMMPFWQAIKAVIYYDLRSRREGLGLQVRDSR